MTHIEIADTTGRTWTGDPGDEELAAEQREQLHELFSDFKRLGHISLEIAGSKRYFNPAHIIAVSIVEDA
jgi:hypothetical protein